MVGCEVSSLRASLTAYEDKFDRVTYNESIREQDLSASTKKAYADDYRHYNKWCARADVEPTPVGETSLLAYLYYWGAPDPELSTDQTCDRCVGFAAIREAQGDRMLKVSTLSRRLTGIRMSTRRDGWVFPAYSDDESNSILVTLKHLKREQGYSPRKARAISERLIVQMANACDDDTKGVRDRAMLLTGFLGGLRRREIVGLDLSDVSFLDEGMRLRIRNSKTDKLRQGQSVSIPLTQHTATCATRCVQRWIELRGDQAGPLFLSLWKNGHIRGNRPDGIVIDRLVKEYVSLVGEDPDLYSAHSLRSGFATSAARANAPVNTIRDQMRHRSLVSLDGYIQEGRAFEHSAVRYLKNL